MTIAEKKRILKERFNEVETAAYAYRDALRVLNLETRDEVDLSTLLYNTTMGLREATDKAKTRLTKD